MSSRGDDLCDLCDLCSSGKRVIQIRSRPSGRYHLYRQLWGLRGAAGPDVAKLLLEGKPSADSGEDSSGIGGGSGEAGGASSGGADASAGKPMDGSMCQVELPFKSNEDLKADYISIYGGIRFGKILEDLDVLAATVAYLHCGTTTPSGSSAREKLTIVTAAVDRIDVLEPLAFDSITDVRLRALPTNVGRSSMECTVVVESQSSGDGSAWTVAAIARFIMVARSADGSRSVAIPKLHSGSAAEAALLRFGEERRSARLTRDRASVLYKEPPLLEESALVHRLFLSRPAGRPFSSTTCRQTQICHPQERNIHNFIFGGYLMREAYELSYACAMMFCSQRVHLLGMDELAFRHPVPIGSILEYHAEVVYTCDHGGDQLLHIEVVADVLDSASGTRHTTNTFHYTFLNPRGAARQEIIPQTYAEAMRYLEARRRVQAGLTAATPPDASLLARPQ